MATRKFRMISAQESGIGGFLLVFALTQILSLGLAVWEIPGAWRAVTGSTAAFIHRVDPSYFPVVIAELVALVVRAFAFVVGLMMIFRRDPRTPVFYMAVLTGIIVIAALDMYFGGRFSDVVRAYLVAKGLATTDFDAAISSERTNNIRMIFYGVIWLLYWRSSERVRLTFTPGPGMTEIPKTT